MSPTHTEVDVERADRAEAEAKRLRLANLKEEARMAVEDYVLRQKQRRVWDLVLFVAGVAVLTAALILVM